MAKTSKHATSQFTLLKLFYLLLVLVVLLTSATYTWFALSRTPKVHDLTLYINSARGLMLSVDPDAPWEEWQVHINYNDHIDYLEYKTELKPATWSDAQQKFYAADFGADGRIRGITRSLSDEANANKKGLNAYYVKFTFYARTDTNIDVSLAEATEQTGNFVVGMPIWDAGEINHLNGGHGAQSAIRVGFLITKFDDNGERLDEDPAFIIYEPNCTSHSDYSGEYRPTPSMDGGETLIESERLIRQTATVWSEAVPVLRDVVVYKYGEFLDDTFMFELDKDQTAQIDMYLWLEGYDEDCTNEIGHDAKIVAGIQFNATSKGNSGMDEID